MRNDIHDIGYQVDLMNQQIKQLRTKIAIAETTIAAHDAILAGEGIAQREMCKINETQRIDISREEYYSLLDDANMLDWAMPILTGEDSDSTDKKAMAIAAALMSGLTGRAAINKAMNK